MATAHTPQQVEVYLSSASYVKMKFEDNYDEELRCV